MLRIGKNAQDQEKNDNSNSRPEVPDYTAKTYPSYQQQTSVESKPVVESAASTSGSRAMTESETLARDIKEGTLSGFVGGGTKPIPLTSEEAESLLKQVDSGTAIPREQIRFVKGDNVRIIDGPFLGFNGLVEEVDSVHNRVKVMVSIFGRSTPVELGFLQVERI